MTTSVVAVPVRRALGLVGVLAVDVVLDLGVGLVVGPAVGFTVAFAAGLRAAL
ncbi:MAG: hypothetical protein ABIV05_07815 [Actinomycetota bacterium]